MKERIENVRQFLKVASSPAIIQWQAITGVAVLSILIHLLASIDLGFEELLPRIIFAGISVVPMFVLITLCLSVKIAAENMFLAFYVLAISVGGVIRGAIIESGLSFLNIESNAIADFRLFAGVVISLIITLTVGYSWATIQSTQSVLTKLRVENEQLTLALSKLEEESRAEESRRVIDLLEHVKNKVESIDSQPRSVQIEELEKIINGFIRPVSKNWALNLGEYAPQYSRTPSVTLRGVWSSLDPTKHLPSPMLSIWIIILSALAAAVGTFGIDVAQQLAITLGVVLFVTLPPGFAFVKRVLGGERSLTKDVLLTVSLVVMTIPTLVATTFVLRNTSNPTAFVLPGLVTVPLLGWILMVGRAALYQSQVIIEELNAIQHRLRWSIARINLLSWYQQGIISRLLHGPIQNSIQVGLIKIQSTTSTDDQNEILGEVLQRIDEAIREVTNESNSSSLETEALAKIPDIWAGVAQIQVILPDDCRVRLMHDVAALSITVDLVHEVCSNAIRHGAATEIAITLNSSADTLVIQGSDNGNSYVPHTNPDGLGAYFIDSCTVTYERERKQGTNTYLLEIPLESTAFVRG